MLFRSRYNEVRDLLPLGGYQAGQDPEMDLAVRVYPEMARFLRQTTHSKVNLAESLVQLEQLMGVMGYEPASSL